ncbi:MAG TPA: hypothetical protein VFD87_08625, partial [Phototrophicaceae bacterium]|nr:hypothetical protein [Phototrophicaceae bacterium]
SLPSCAKCRRLAHDENPPSMGDVKSDRSVTAEKAALLVEERKLRRLGRAMDLATALLWQVDLTLEEARDVVNHAKQTALQLFPNKEATFDLIYGPRFRRILSEKYRLQ